MPEISGIKLDLEFGLRSLVPEPHFFDFAATCSYANGWQEIWDTWGRLTQPLADHLPWMVAVGNHELIDLLVPFLERFSMPGMRDQIAL